MAPYVPHDAMRPAPYVALESRQIAATQTSSKNSKNPLISPQVRSIIFPFASRLRGGLPAFAQNDGGAVYESNSPFHLLRGNRACHHNVARRYDGDLPTGHQ